MPFSIKSSSNATYKTHGIAVRHTHGLLIKENSGAVRGICVGHGWGDLGSKSPQIQSEEIRVEGTELIIAVDISISLVISIKIRREEIIP